MFKLAKFPGRLRLFRRCTIFAPTCTGAFCIALVLLILIFEWVTHAESFLALTEKLPGDVLVVEGWIGRNGIRASTDEFQHGNYRYIVANGGLTSGRWGEDAPTSYAEMAALEMIRSGIPRAKIIVATSQDTERHRIFASAIAVLQVLDRMGIRPKRINVFSFGPHARRSALVFRKVFDNEMKVGIIAWMPPEYESEPWWRSSERSRELLDESVAYLYELAFNSGRPPSSGNLLGRPY
jgi:hypothetical protein